MKRYGRLDENLQGTLQKNRVFCAVMPIHDQRISRRTETRRLFELTKLKKAPSFVIVGLFSADHYLVPCLSLLSSECVVFTDVPRDFQRLAEYFSDGWRREGVIDSSCLFKIGAEVRTVRWKISNNTHPVPVLNNTHPFPSKCSVDALCRVRESVRFASIWTSITCPIFPSNFLFGFSDYPLKIEYLKNPFFATFLIEKWPIWAVSSAGRARRSHRRGRGFDPLTVHQNWKSPQ